MCELLRQTLAAASVTHLVSKCSLRPTLCWEHCSGHWDIPLCSEKPDKPESCVHTHENSRWWQVLTDGQAVKKLSKGVGEAGGGHLG